MATNRKYANARRLSLNVSAVNGSGAGDLVLSGDPVAVGQIPGVAMTNEDANGLASVDLGGAYDLPVTGINDTPTNTAVAVGDILYWDNTLGRLDVGPNGVRFGYALGAVVAGATTTIPVKLGY